MKIPGDYRASCARHGDGKGKMGKSQPDTPVYSVWILQQKVHVVVMQGVDVAACSLCCTLYILRLLKGGLASTLLHQQLDDFVL